MNKYQVIAIDNLETTDNHTWTKGLVYEVAEKSDYFTLASNEGSVNYYNNVKDDVFTNFNIIQNESL